MQAEEAVALMDISSHEKGQVIAAFIQAAAQYLHTMTIRWLADKGLLTPGGVDGVGYFHSKKSGNLSPLLAAILRLRVSSDYFR